MRSDVAVLACIALIGCKRSVATDVAGDAPSPPVAAPGVAVVADAGDAAPRCTVASGANVPSGSTLAGSAAVVGERVYVGTVGSGPTGIGADVVSDDGSASWRFGAGPSLVADAPPPLPIAGANGALYAVGIARAAADAGRARSLALVKLAAGGKVEPVASFAQHADDPFGLDAAASSDGARVAIAWEDATGIALAVVPVAGGSAPAPRAASPDGVEVDQPRIAARTGGWWAAWIEHKAEEDAAAPRVEGPGDDRAFAWVDLVALDASGAPAGNVRRVTSLTGHVASYDLASRPSGELDLFARDDTEAHEASGGRLLHVVVNGDHVADAVVLVDSAVGRGSVDALVSPSGDAWLTWFDRDDHARVAPLDSARALARTPSVEPALDGARLIAFLGGKPGARFVAFGGGGGEAGVLRTVTCAR